MLGLAYETNFISSFFVSMVLRMHRWPYFCHISAALFLLLPELFLMHLKTAMSFITTYLSTWIRKLYWQRDSLWKHGYKLDLRLAPIFWKRVCFQKEHFYCVEIKYLLDTSYLLINLLCALSKMVSLCKVDILFVLKEMNWKEVG